MIQNIANPFNMVDPFNAHQRHMNGLHQAAMNYHHHYQIPFNCAPSINSGSPVNNGNSSFLTETSTSGTTIDITKNEPGAITSYNGSKHDEHTIIKRDEKKASHSEHSTPSPSFVKKTTKTTRRTKTKRIRTTFTPDQLRVLEHEFAMQMYLVGEYREVLAHSLGLSEGQVKVWFQNRRIKQRKLVQQQGK